MSDDAVATAATTRWFVLQKRLLLLLLMGISLSTLTVLAFFYLDVRHETDELLDAQLAQAAQTLLALASQMDDEHDLPMVIVHPQNQARPGKHDDSDDDHNRHGRHRHHNDQDDDHALTADRHLSRRGRAEIAHLAHKYQSRLRFQLWSADEGLLLRSDHAPHDRSLATVDGFSESRDATPAWRHYREWSPDRRLRVEVSEDLSGRLKLSGEVVEHLLLPLAWLLPLMVLWVWWVTRRSLSPLSKIATEVATRSPSQLTQLVPTVAPSEIRPLLDALNRLFDRVAATLISERQFTADAAHELRTPLAALQADLQVATRAAAGSCEQTQALVRMQAGLNRSIHLIEQLLQLARLEPEAALPAPCSVDLAVIAESVCAELGAAILANNIDFQWSTSGDTRLSGQEEWLRVMLKNLVENAIRHCPAGSSLCVAIEGRSDNDAATALQCVIEDSGNGIPVDQRQAVLRRFYRLNESAAPGSGLGLAIAARIAELHGARLTLASGKDGRGLRVSITWPMVAQP